MTAGPASNCHSNSQQNNAELDYIGNGGGDKNWLYSGPILKVELIGLAHELDWEFVRERRDNSNSKGFWPGR